MKVGQKVVAKIREDTVNSKPYEIWVAEIAELNTKFDRHRVQLLNLVYPDKTVWTQLKEDTLGFSCFVDEMCPIPDNISSEQIQALANLLK